MASQGEAVDEQEEQALRLQRMETRLVDGLFEHPGILPRSREHQLRYAIALAGLDTFQPGAARRGRRLKRAEVEVRTPRLERWRRQVLDGLGAPLLQIKDSRERVLTASARLAPWLLQMSRARQEVLERYASDFTERQLDQELGIKTLVSVAGGGGGAGYVYIGAWDVLQAAGLVPAYVVGASMGAVIGLFRARARAGTSTRTCGSPGRCAPRTSSSS